MGEQPGSGSVVDRDPNEVELTVGRATEAPRLATAILRFFEEGKRPVLSCIGAESIAVGVKAVAIANGEAAPQGVLLQIHPAFQQKRFPDRRTFQQVEMTAMRLIIKRVAI